MAPDTGDIARVKARRRLYVLPEWRLAYLSIPKNACTSLKWLVAELAGEDLDRIRRGDLGFSPTREGQIHDRRLWQKVLPVGAIDPDVRAAVSPENGWFVFGVLRDPRLRLFSAWQDKYLLRSPGYWKHWDRPEAPSVPRTPEDIIGAFRDFVLEVAAQPGHEALDDGHFVTQVHALNEDVVPFSRVYDMAELGELMGDLTEHLQRQGHPGGLTLGRSNKSPFEPNAAVFAGGVREAVEQIYAEDFERFGDRWDFRRIEERTATWSPDAFAHAHSVIATNERMADVVRAARRLRKQNAALERRTAELQEELDRLSSAATSRPRRRGRS